MAGEHFLKLVLLNTDIDANIEVVAKAMDLKLVGFAFRLVSSPSLSRSGLMAMELNGADRGTIPKKRG
jgi:hypothetical protein